MDYRRTCPFCNHDIREGDEVYVITAGCMDWAEQAAAIFCDPYVSPIGEHEEYVFHASCFSDGPEREVENLLSAELSLPWLEQPHCTVCDSKLEVGDDVFMIQFGTVVRMDLKARPIYAEKDERTGLRLTVYALYVHFLCIPPPAEMYFPFPADWMNSEEEVGRETFPEMEEIPY